MALQLDEVDRPNGDYVGKEVAKGDGKYIRLVI